MKKAQLIAACLAFAAMTACGSESSESKQAATAAKTEISTTEASTVETTSAETTSAETTAAEPSTAEATSLPSRQAENVIQDIVTYHGSYGDKADTKVKELLSELGSIDKDQGALWTDIMEYWDYANNELEVHTDKLPDDLAKDDSLCIVVLGFELNDNGTMKDELIGRLKVAKACAEQYPNAYVVCTGGGTAKDNPDATEADLMGNWLLENGLDKNRLIIENRSLTTAENANYSYDILLKDYPQVNSVAIVSSSYHIAWGSLLFEAEFMKIASERNTPQLHVISNCAYETVNDDYKMSDMLRWETGGMLQLIGNNDLAMEYYYDTYEKPEL